MTQNDSYSMCLAAPSDRAIAVARVLDAPRALVLEGERSVARDIVDRFRQVLAAIAELFGTPLQIESLDSKVRAGMTAKERGISDAYLYGSE